MKVCDFCNSYCNSGNLNKTQYNFYYGGNLVGSSYLRDREFTNSEFIVIGDGVYRVASVKDINDVRGSKIAIGVILDWLGRYENPQS